MNIALDLSPTFLHTETINETFQQSEKKKKKKKDSLRHLMKSSASNKYESSGSVL